MSGAQQILMAGGGISGTLVCGQTTVGYTTLTGFDSFYSIGTISPTSFNGYPIVALETASLAGQLNFQLNGSIPNGVFSALVLAGVRYPVSAASYSNSGSSTVWSWSAYGVLSAGQTVSFSIS